MADLGCGEGVILNALGSRGLLEGKSVYAVDMTEERVNRANRTYTHIKCLTADVCHTPIESDSIDLLITTQVIEHVDYDEDLVKEIQRVLAPGGIAYVDTIFKKWYGWYFYRCNGKWTMDPTHVREYGNDAVVGPFSSAWPRNIGQRKIPAPGSISRFRVATTGRFKRLIQQ
jgi:2-polyprenyl-3-methyl-5-hydroxy-6-metoxy-1,4-benzoquinol methylase